MPQMSSRRRGWGAWCVLGALSVLALMPALAQTPRPQIGGNPPMPKPRNRGAVPGTRVQVVAQNLEIPWALAFAPDGRIFFTERPGRVRVMRTGQLPGLYKDLSQVTHNGEGGLMGMALHPHFPEQPYVYVHYTRKVGEQSFNRVSRFRDTGTTMVDEEVVVDNIPASQFHDGGALAFGPEGMLYVGTGDARVPGSAQQWTSLAGKILRVAPDGRIPADNPFPGSPVWAYGFRNVSGLAWNPVNGELWATSHGPTGEFANLHNRDSVYVVQKGGNHGWPLIVGTSADPSIVSPVLYYPTAAVPPGGAMFYTGDRFPKWKNMFFFTSLRAEQVQRVTLGAGNSIQTIERWFTNRYGRLRAIAQAPDGSIYFTTSNRDDRARRRFPGADRIYRLTTLRN